MGFEKRTIEIEVPVCDICGQEAWKGSNLLIVQGKQVVYCGECDEKMNTRATVLPVPPKKEAPKKAETKFVEPPQTFDQPKEPVKAPEKEAPKKAAPPKSGEKKVALVKKPSQAKREAK